MRARNHHWDKGVSPLLGFGDHDEDDDEGEPAEDPDEGEAPGENVDFGESEEAAEPKVITKPCRPSMAEVEAHNKEAGVEVHSVQSARAGASMVRGM